MFLDLANGVAQPVGEQRKPIAKPVPEPEPEPMEIENPELPEMKENFNDWYPQNVMIFFQSRQYKCFFLYLGIKLQKVIGKIYVNEEKNEKLKKLDLKLMAKCQEEINVKKRVF